MDRARLPSGGWVEFCDPSTLKAKHKKRVLRRLRTLDMERPMSSGIDYTDAIACEVITCWEVPYLPDAPLPSENPDLLDELDIDDYDELIAALAPFLDHFNRRRPTPDDAEDETSPSVPASE